jgi:hypothetical protein
MKKLYKFYVYCGRNGELEGTFISTEEKVNKNLGKEAYFSDVLGKHSEFLIPLDGNNITVLTDDQDFIEKFEKFVGKTVGINPLDYVSDEEFEQK